MKSLTFLALPLQCWNLGWKLRPQLRNYNYRKKWHCAGACAFWYDLKPRGLSRFLCYQLQTILEIEWSKARATVMLSKTEARRRRRRRDRNLRAFCILSRTANKVISWNIVPGGARHSIQLRLCEAVMEKLWPWLTLMHRALLTSHNSSWLPSANGHSTLHMFRTSTTS